MINSLQSDTWRPALACDQEHPGTYSCDNAKCGRYSVVSWYSDYDPASPIAQGTVLASARTIALMAGHVEPRHVRRMSQKSISAEQWIDMDLGPRSCRLRPFTSEHGADLLEADRGGDEWAGIDGTARVRRDCRVEAGRA